MIPRDADDDVPGTRPPKSAPKRRHHDARETGAEVIRLRPPPGAGAKLRVDAMRLVARMTPQDRAAFVDETRRRWPEAFGAGVAAEASS